MSRRHPKDRALCAVARVREVREQDSRIGLQRALAAEEDDTATVRDARHRLTGRPGFTHGASAAFLAERGLLAAMALLIDEHQRQSDASRGVAEEARRRWQQDRTRLRAVETLLARRAEERSTERARREAADRDDLAGQGWLRRQTTPSSAGSGEHETKRGTP